jgi:hypothetical protein
MLRADVGITSANDGGTQVEAAILQCLVKTQMEIYSRAPNTWVSEVPRAEVIKAPTNVTLTVTQDAKNITFAGFQAWMLGCTIIIAGDTAQNQLTQDGSATTSLVKPFNGPSGVTTAIVYHDSIDLGSDVFRIGSPVMLDQHWELAPVDTTRDLQWAQPGVFQGIGPYYGTSYGINQGFASDRLRTQDKRILQPFAFRVGRVFGYNVKQTCKLSLSSLPDTRYGIDYPAQVVPLITSLADTTRPEYLPFGYDETIFVPWARWNWATQPHNTMTQAVLKPAFDGATAMLKGLVPQTYVEEHVSCGGRGGW